MKCKRAFLQHLKNVVERTFNISIPDDYDGSSDDVSSNDDRTINLNNVLSGFRDDDGDDDGRKPKNGGYKKIVLKEFPSATSKPVATTHAYDEMTSEDNWMRAGLKPPSPPFTTIWPDTKLSGEFLHPFLPRCPNHRS